MRLRPTDRRRNAVRRCHARLPAYLALRFTNVAYVDLLIARTPRPPLRDDRASEMLPQMLQEFEQRERMARSAANVVDADAGPARQERLVRTQQVSDEQHIAHLFAIAVYRDGRARQGGDDEPCQ